MSIAVEIPADQWLSANQRMHWAVKARRTSWLRTEAAVAVTDAIADSLIEPIHLARVIAHISMPSRRRSDPGNAAPTVKALIDGCVQAGLLPDDDRAHLLGPDYRAGAPTHQFGVYVVELEFQELDDIANAA